MHIMLWHLWQTAFDIGNLQKDGNHLPVNACSLGVPGSFTGASRMLHGCFTGVSRVLHGCFTGVSRVAHGTQSVFRVSNPVFCVSNTLVSLVVHGWFTGGSWVVPGWFTGGSRIVHGLWAAVEGDCKQWNWYKLIPRALELNQLGKWFAVICR